MSAPHRLALVGIGKIAIDQHLPALSNNPAFELVALVSPRIHRRHLNSCYDNIRRFTSLTELLAANLAIDAVMLCTSPQVRYQQARQALAAQLAVGLEKPPGITLSEIDDLRRFAVKQNQVLFFSWHSRYAAQIANAKRWLLNQTINQLTVYWHEDVQRWHQGQNWIWQPGGMGVFDAGINALSIVTEITQQTLRLTQVTLQFPQNQQTPIAAQLIGELTAKQTPCRLDFNWLHHGAEKWQIQITTQQGELVLTEGGQYLTINDKKQTLPSDYQGEYAGVYAQFAQLLKMRQSLTDDQPLQIVADAFLRAERQIVAPFYWQSE